MEYEDTFEKTPFVFWFVENQRRQSMWFKENLKIQCKSLCLTTF